MFSEFICEVVVGLCSEFICEGVVGLVSVSLYVRWLWVCV